MEFSIFAFTTFTVTVASPAVFTSTAHELHPGDTIWLETTGALPTGLSVDTTYYIVRDSITANTFKISATEDGDPITTTGSQSGTHSYIKTNRASLEPAYEDNR